MYKIQDRTPEYKGYKIGEDGNYILPRNKNGVICLYYLYCYKYGPNTLGLIDGSKTKEEDWEDLRIEFILIFPNKTFKKFYCVGGSDTGVIGGYNKYKSEATPRKKSRLIPSTNSTLGTGLKKPPRLRSTKKNTRRQSTTESLKYLPIIRYFSISPQALCKPTWITLLRMEMASIFWSAKQQRIPLSGLTGKLQCHI